MDRKSIIVLVVCFLLLIAWYPLVNKLYPPKPLPPQSTNVVGAASNQTSLTSVPVPPAPATAAPASSASAPAAPAVQPAAPEQTLVLETADARYTFSSHRGGLKLVELLRYPANVGCRNGTTDTNALASLNTGAPLPALALLGGEALEGDGVWTLSKTAGNAVRAEKQLPNGLALVKEFAAGGNYVLTASVRLENRSAQPLALPAQEWVVGTATPISAKDDGLTMGVYWFDGSSAEHVDETWFANRSFFGCLGVPSQPRAVYQSHGGAPVWAAVHNQFFTMIAVPRNTGAPPAAVVSRHIELPPLAAPGTPGVSAIASKPFGFQTALVFPAAVLAPGQKWEQSFDLYAGPKEYKILSRLDHKQELVMAFGGFFGFFAKALLLSMNGLHALFGGLLGYGWVIILITVVIKLVFWPLTNASTKSMKRMAALQPQMKALQEKYKDDPKKMNQKLMEFMKEHKVNPMGGCLPMLLQIPVFFGFFTMIRTAIELRGAKFLWVCDLSQPDTLFVLPGLNFPFNLMPLLMGVTMFYQARMTPASPGMDPMQQKIMKYMPLMFLVFLYNFSAGLTLYWTVQNLLTIAQMKITKATDPAAPAPGAKSGAPAPAKPAGPPPKRRR
jgi:YidC/Oxa1 family membrane protein insertase